MNTKELIETIKKYPDKDIEFEDYFGNTIFKLSECNVADVDEHIRVQYFGIVYEMKDE